MFRNEFSMSQAKNLDFYFFTFLKPGATSFLECYPNQELERAFVYDPMMRHRKLRI